MDALFTILLCLVGALVVSFVLHRIDAKAHRFRPLDPLIDGLPLGTTASGYLLFVALTGRPVLAMVLLWGGAGLLDVLNRLKLRFFHEPILFLDLTLASQIIRYPRFYVPYLFPPPVFWAGGLAVAGLAGIWLLGTPVRDGWRIVSALLVLALTAGAWYRLGRLFLPRHRQTALALLDRYRPNFVAMENFRRLGVLGSAFVHGLWHVQARSRDGQPGIPPLSRSRRSASCRGRPDAAHLVLVQAESFCDIRRHIPEVPADILAATDQLRAQGQGGRLLVPTHGAYTMRTEFSVLTGLAPGQLGTDAFNPYWTAARSHVWSLAWALREVGYHTVCLHPFHPTFFQRHRVMPNLGFDTFVSLDAFAKAPNCGPYVCDATLGRAVLDRVRNSRSPMFVFAITIEAHGPWKQDRFRPMPDAVGLPRGELETYLWHLRHMDGLFGDLAAGLGTLSRPAVLAGYGDHVPCLPGVGGAGVPDATATDWFVWRSRARQAQAPRHLLPEQLHDMLRQALRQEHAGENRL